MTRIGLSVAFLLLAISSFCWPQARGQYDFATVHIVYLAWDGTEMGKVVVQAFRIEEGKEFKSLFRDNTAHNIPYGVYDLTADLNGFLPDRKMVDVVQPEVWVVVHPWFVHGDTIGYGPDFVVKGTVKNIGRNEEPIYVRLVGVYNQYSQDTKVQTAGTSGTFNLSGIGPDGRYVLITTGRSGVLDMRALTTGNAPWPPVEIDLAKSSTTAGTPSKK